MNFSPTEEQQTVRELARGILDAEATQQRLRAAERTADAVLSVVQSIGEPRYPSFMGIRKASKAEIPVWPLGDLGMTAPAAIVTRAELLNPPVRETTVEIITGENPGSHRRNIG